VGCNGTIWEELKNVVWRFGELLPRFPPAAKGVTGVVVALGRIDLVVFRFGWVVHLKLNRPFILSWNWPAHGMDDGLTRT
jgi:hypothetical protein